MQVEFLRKLEGFKLSQDILVSLSEDLKAPSTGNLIAEFMLLFLTQKFPQQYISWKISKPIEEYGDFSCDLC